MHCLKTYSCFSVGCSSPDLPEGSGPAELLTLICVLSCRNLRVWIAGLLHVPMRVGVLMGLVCSGCTLLAKNSSPERCMAGVHVRRLLLACRQSCNDTRINWQGGCEQTRCNSQQYGKKMLLLRLRRNPKRMSKKLVHKMKLLACRDTKVCFVHCMAPLISECMTGPPLHHASEVHFSHVKSSETLEIGSSQRTAGMKIVAAISALSCHSYLYIVFALLILSFSLLGQQ